MSAASSAQEYRYHLAMVRSSGKVHVVRVAKTGYMDKQGQARDYSSAYLRRTYRDGGTVKNETVATCPCCRTMSST